MQNEAAVFRQRASQHHRFIQTDLWIARLRDYFELLWYLQKGIQPNLSCIEGFENMKDLKDKLLEQVARIDGKSIQLDLEALIANPGFVTNMSKSMKAILEREISEKM